MSQSLLPFGSFDSTVSKESSGIMSFLFKPMLVNCML